MKARSDTCPFWNFVDDCSIRPRKGGIEGSTGFPIGKWNPISLGNTRRAHSGYYSKERGKGDMKGRGVPQKQSFRDFLFQEKGSHLQKREEANACLWDLLCWE